MSFTRRSPFHSFNSPTPLPSDPLNGTRHVLLRSRRLSSTIQAKTPRHCLKQRHTPKPMRSTGMHSRNGEVHTRSTRKRHSFSSFTIVGLMVNSHTPPTFDTSLSHFLDSAQTPYCGTKSTRRSPWWNTNAQLGADSGKVTHTKRISFAYRRAICRRSRVAFTYFASTSPASDASEHGSLCGNRTSFS